MPPPALVLVFWAMILVAQSLWVLGAVAAFKIAGRTVTRVRLGRGPGPRLRVAGIEVRVGVLPVSWAIECSAPLPSSAGHVVALLAAWAPPLAVALVLLGPTGALQHLRTGFEVLLDPWALPEASGRLRTLLAGGELATASGTLLTQWMVVNLIPLPPTALGGLLYLPLRQHRTTNKVLLSVALSGCFYLLAALYLLDARWALQAGPQAIAEARASSAEEDRSVAARRRADERSERLQEPVTPWDFVSPVLLVSSVACLVGGLRLQVRRHQQGILEQLPELLGSLGYLAVYGASEGDPLTPSVRRAILEGQPFAVQRDYHGVPVTFQVGGTAFWSAPLPHDKPWRLETKRLDETPPWLSQTKKLGDKTLDARFLFAGDPVALTSMLARDPAIRELLLGLGWVSLEVRHGIVEFHDRSDRLVGSLVGGSVGARFITVEEWLQLNGACHEQLAELLARMVRANR